MNSLIGLIYSLTFLYIVSGDAQVYMPSVEDGDDDGQTGGQSDDPVNTPINQDDQAPAATQPAVITTSLADSGDGKIPFTQKPFIAKLIDKSNNIYHKESKDRRSFIISNIEAYKLPANNLLIRSRFIGAIDWIIHKPDFESNNLPFIRPGTAVNHGKSANHLKLLLRNKRQADSYGMPNPGNGQGPPMGAGDRPMGNNPVGGIRQFFGRLREIMNDIRRAFSGNRVDTNMQGMGNMPGMGNTPGMEENLPNLPK